MSDDRPILIAGPTASGKSELALRLAEHYGGVVINADSMQVYRDLRVLTARPGPDEERRAPHALYGFVSGSDAYSAGRYAVDAKRTLEEARAVGRRPIFVGGTGLYFKTLIEGLAPIPPVPDAIRSHWRATAESISSEELHRELAGRDPEMAQRLSPTDPQRLVRALEVIEATGVSLIEWQRLPGEPVLAGADTVCLVISPERPELHARINVRVERMMAAGAPEEAAALDAHDLDPARPIMGALGVRPLLAYRHGQLTLSEAVDATQAETRQYAKRQLTWARRNMISWKWLSEKEIETIEASAITFIDDGR